MTNGSTKRSDWDVAVWVEGKVDALRLWSVSDALAKLCGSHVTLIDLRQASTVMQYQVITTGQRAWLRDKAVEHLEAMVLSQKTSLDEARGPLLDEIMARGKVLG